MTNVSLIAREIERLNSTWMGYKYIVLSTDVSFSGVAMNSLGITQVEFPNVNIEYREIPSISTKQEFIPSRKITGDLILRAPIVRNTALFEAFSNQSNALLGAGNKSFNLIIGEYGDANLVDVPPITIWFAMGCQAKSFRTASADANYAGDIPLEELTLRVNDFYRPTF